MQNMPPAHVGGGRILHKANCGAVKYHGASQTAAGTLAKAVLCSRTERSWSHARRPSQPWDSTGTLSVPDGFARKIRLRHIGSDRVTVRGWPVERDQPYAVWLNVLISLSPTSDAGEGRLMHYLLGHVDGRGQCAMSWYVAKVAGHTGDTAEHAYFDALTGRQTYCSCRYSPKSTRCEWALENRVDY